MLKEENTVTYAKQPAGKNTRELQKVWNCVTRGMLLMLLDPIPF